MSDYDQQPASDPAYIPPEQTPLSCGICGSEDVETWPGFGGPDVHFCINCGALKDDGGEWQDPNAWF